MFSFYQLVSSAELIPVWTYYSYPPFITGEHQGLSYDFVDLLNDSLEGDDYQFELKLLPRTRINRNLNDNMAGIVLFVNWLWMSDQDKTKYLWSPAILDDQNEIISRRDGKPPVLINFTDAKALKGIVFGGVRGHQYKGLEASFASGHIIRRDVREVSQNLDLLLRGRIDFTTANTAVIRAALKQKGLEDTFYFSQTPLFSYTRHLLLTKKLKHLEPFINQFIQNLGDNPQWDVITKKYDLKKSIH